jgi:Obg family GTPase CgtA
MSSSEIRCMLRIYILLLCCSAICKAFTIPGTEYPYATLRSSSFSALHTYDTRRNIRQQFTALHESVESDELDSEDQYFSPNAALKDVSGDMVSTTSEEKNLDQDSFNEYSFFDEATIYVRAGSGGQGSSTYKKAPGGQNGQPDGGDGGKGGDVILVADDSLNTLAGLTRAWRPNSFGGGGAATTSTGFRPISFRAENGQDGARQFKNGRYGKEVIIRVPPGTVVQEEIDEFEVDEETGKKHVVSTELVDLGTVTLDEDNRKVFCVALGGEGGEGSGSQGFKKGRGVRRTRAPPKGGERKRLKLTLKIVADVALVGVPNAGKSTFLASVTRAKPKIANYPFTTVIPNLGVWIPPNEYNSDGSSAKSFGAGSEGLALCVSSRKNLCTYTNHKYLSHFTFSLLHE